MRDLKIFKEPFFWLGLLLLLVWAAVFSLPDGNLHLYFCQVGQGDAILVTYRQTQVLIDGGPDQQVLNCLAKHLPFYDRQIEAVFLTHPEEDHFTGLIDVLKRYNVRYFVANSLVKESNAFQVLQQLVSVEKSSVYQPQKDDQIKLGQLALVVLWPPDLKKIKNSDLNDLSLVLRLDFGDFQALLSGDISSEVEKQLVLKKVEVLKVAHHGSKFSTSEEFLAKVQPQVAIISVGKNRFGHPTSEVIQRLQALGIKIFRTDQNGEIEITTNGTVWQVSPGF
ncbi:MBL fold metallo-hydrolase [Candidatus Shapirobacteria bacterium]|nr:MBL fold metallo-hydrolase [Candidatus Shapirobacteria bacterium]